MRPLALIVAIFAAALTQVRGLENPPSPIHGPAQSHSDAKIKTDILRGWVVNPEVRATDIRVSVTRRVVTLTGTVRNKKARAMAAGMTRDVPGVLEVKNRLQVQ